MTHLSKKVKKKPISPLPEEGASFPLFPFFSLCFRQTVAILFACFFVGGKALFAVGWIRGGKAAIYRTIPAGPFGEFDASRSARPRWAVSTGASDLDLRRPLLGLRRRPAQSAGESPNAPVAPGVSAGTPLAMPPFHRGSGFWVTPFPGGGTREFGEYRATGAGESRAVIPDRCVSGGPHA